MLFAAAQILAQSGKLNGRVFDNETKQPLDGATILIEQTKSVVVSDDKGNFLFESVRPGKYKINFSRLGYETVAKEIEITDKGVENLEVGMTKAVLPLGETVVVSARTFSVKNELPLPIETVDAEAIEKNVDFTVSDFAGAEPGVNLIRDGIWAAAVNIRGLSKQNVVYQVDGNRIETSTNIAAGLSLIDVNDISKIEIVKGGLSSLYGTGATGGVVNIFTKTASYSNGFQFGGSLISGYSGVNEGTSNGMNLTASSNNWKAKISGSYRKAGDTRIPDGTLTNSGFTDYSFSASAGFLITDKLSVKGDYQKFEAKDVGLPGGAPFPQNSTASYPLSSRELFSGEIEYANVSESFLKLKLRGYRQFIRREAEIIANPNVTVAPSADHTTIGALLQSDWLFGRNHYVIAGIDSWQRKYEGERTKTIKSLNKIIVDKPVPNSSFANLGFFAQDEIRLTEMKLNVTLGGRYDFIFVKSDETQNPNYIISDGNVIVPPPDPDASYAAADVTNKSFSGNVGLLYGITDALSLSFNSAYAFRSPSLEERFQYIDLGGIVYLGNPELQPEKSISFDLGARYNSNRLRLSVNGFANFFNDLVIDDVAIPDSLYRKENVGEARLVGFELSGDYNFYSDFVFSASLSFVEGLNTLTDEYLPQMPPLNGRAGLRFPVANLFDVDFTAVFFADQNKTAPNENRTPGYTFYNVEFSSRALDLSLAKLKIYVGAENIFDRSYKNHLSTYRDYSLTEPGRNIYAKVKIYW